MSREQRKVGTDLKKKQTMAEKGEKRFSVPAAKKATASKSNGKDGSLSKTTKKVQFESSDSEGSPTTNSKTSFNAGGKDSSQTPFASKDDWAKGGKADRMGKTGGKGASLREPIVKVIAESQLKIEEELPKNAKCLMDCEAAVVLEGIQEQLTFLSDDPSIKVPESFSKGLQYAKSGSLYTSPELARKALLVLKRKKISDGEMCLIGNVCPETVEEAFALIPSLKDQVKDEGLIKDVVNELSKLKSVRNSDG